MTASASSLAETRRLELHSGDSVHPMKLVLQAIVQHHVALVRTMALDMTTLLEAAAQGQPQQLLQPH
jgi:hypothetical protein